MTFVTPFNLKKKSNFVKFRKNTENKRQLNWLQLHNKHRLVSELPANVETLISKVRTESIGIMIWPQLDLYRAKGRGEAEGSGWSVPPEGDEVPSEEFFRGWQLLCASTAQRRWFDIEQYLLIIKTIIIIITFNNDDNNNNNNNIIIIIIIIIIITNNNKEGEAVSPYKDPQRWL